MTPLKTLILQALRKDGPLSDLGLLEKIPDQETGGLSATVVMCCLELQQERLIEPPHNDPHLWQLTNKGLDYVATKLSPSNAGGDEC
jgi:hypothetical protein